MVLEEIHVKLQLTTLKPLHTQRLTELYNHIATNEGKADGMLLGSEKPLLRNQKPMLALFEEECNITKFLQTPEENRKVLRLLPVLHSDDKDDKIFELEKRFSDVFDTFVNEQFKMKEKNGFNFHLGFILSPKFLQSQKFAYEKFIFQHYRKIKTSRNICWSNHEIKMLRNIVSGLKVKIKMPRNPKIAQKPRECGMAQYKCLSRGFAIFHVTSVKLYS